MQLELFGRPKPDANALAIDWDAVSGHDLATDELLLRRYLREERPRVEAQMQRWARSIRPRRNARHRAERPL